MSANKEELEGLAASIFADTIYGIGKYSISHPKQADFVDILIEPCDDELENVKLQVVQSGSGENHFRHSDQNSKIANNPLIVEKPASWQLTDVDPVQQVCNVLESKIKNNIRISLT